MAIKIIEQPDIYLHNAEYRQLLHEWREICKYHVNPPTFEDYVRSRQSKELLEE